MLSPTPSFGLVVGLAFVLKIVRAAPPIPILDEFVVAVHAVFEGSGFLVSRRTVQSGVGKTGWAFIAVVAAVDTVRPAILVVSAPWSQGGSTSSRVSGARVTSSMG